MGGERGGRQRRQRMRRKLQAETGRGRNQADDGRRESEIARERESERGREGGQKMI